MSQFYDEMATVARELLAEFGAPIAFTRITGEVRSPSTGIVTTPGLVTTHSPNGVFIAIKSNLIDGTRIKAGDNLLVTDASFTPAMTDKLSGWFIQEISESNPAGTPLVYFTRVRK